MQSLNCKIRLQWLAEQVFQLLQHLPRRHRLRTESGSCVYFMRVYLHDNRLPVIVWHVYVIN